MKSKSRTILRDAFTITKTGCSNRLEYIDQLRGLAVLLVVLQHCGCATGNYILGFHMPLFFFLSGHTYRTIGIDTQIKDSLFIIKKGKRLLIPYFCFELLNLIISLILLPLTKYELNIKDALISIFLCINTNSYEGVSLRLWFLPCIFISEIIFFLVKNYVKRDRYLFIISMIMLGASLILSFFYKGRLPFTIDLSLIATTFIIWGYLLNRVVDRIMFQIKALYQSILMLVGCIGLYTSVFINYETILMYQNQFGNYGLFLLGCGAGFVAFFSMYGLLQKSVLKTKFYSNLVNWLGANSLAIFPIHIVLVWLIYRILYNGFGITFWLIRFLLVFIFMIPIVNFITKNMGFMLGNFKKKDLDKIYDKRVFLTDRLIYWDLLKGISIVLVVFGHSIQYGSGQAFYIKESFFEDVVFQTIYSFHMPLLMTVSGYLLSFSVKKYNFSESLQEKLIAY